MNDVYEVVELKATRRVHDMSSPETRHMMFMDSFHKVRFEDQGPKYVEDFEQTMPVEYREAKRFARCVDGKIESFWVLWTPELEKFLGIPLSVVDVQTRRIDELLRSNADYQMEVRGLKEDAKELTGRIFHFNSLPWYKRAWLALKGDCV